MAFALTSPAFSDQDPIPRKYSGEAENLSPPLRWNDVPPETRELALICEDPDAPQEKPFVHWLLYRIPSSIGELPEGITAEARLAEPLRAEQGRGSSGKIGYAGPMPPVGHGTHHYIFSLFALSAPIDLPPGADRTALLLTMTGKILHKTQLIGTYERKSIRKIA